VAAGSTFVGGHVSVVPRLPLDQPGGQTK
jgi:hypothetical protein